MRDSIFRTFFVMKDKLLYSKIQIPEIQKNLMIRERLLKKIDRCPQKMIIFHGTVGYGKTVLMSQYVRIYEINCAWYHLDAMDNQTETFLTYLTAAVRMVWKSFSFDTAPYRQQDGSLKMEALSSDFILRLNSFFDAEQGTSRKLILVMDDFQMIENEDIFFFIEWLMAYSHKNLKIFIAAKSRLPEFAAAFLMRDEAAVINMEELAFTRDEVSGVLEKILHEDVRLSVSENVFKKTEGWPAGIMFMAQYFKRVGGAENEPDWELVNDEALIQNYIMNELFRKLPYDIQQFLIQTSMLDELSVELCNYALGITDSRSTLNYLLQENLFILRINKKSGYFRYHSIFKKFLMRSILPEKKQEILGRAAEWYMKRGNGDRALQYMEPDKKEDSVPGEMYIRFFGTFSVQVGDERHEMSWRTKKAAELFAYMFLLKGKPIKRDALLRVLWPENYPNNAVAMLHNMFYNIRKELFPFEQNERLRYSGKEYSMEVSGIVTDLEHIRKICRAVENKDMVYLSENSEAFENFWGVYLDGIESAWCAHERYYYEKSFLDGCRLLGCYFMDHKKYDNAIKVLKAALAVDVYAESTALLLMQCYARIRERREGKKFYEKLCRIYQSDLGTVPGTDIVKAYEQCIAGRV